VAFGRLSESRGGTPTGEPRPKRGADGNIGLRGADDDPQLRLSAFRFPLFFAWPGWKSGSNFGEAGLSEDPKQVPPLLFSFARSVFALHVIALT